jgi:outer membrane receptor for ferrienterochelin and colicins
LEQRTVDAPANVTIISSDEIKRHSYRTLGEALAAQSGFYTSYDRHYSYVGVRGFSTPGDYNTKVLFMIDGQRLNDKIYLAGQSGSDFPLDMDLIDHIEVIRGPGSALYGTSAMFAVVDVITKNSRDVKNGEVALMAGNFSTDQARAPLSHVFENDTELLLSATRYHSDGDDDLYFKEFVDPASNNGHAENIDEDDAYSLFFKTKIEGFTLEALYNKREKSVPTAPWDTIFNRAVESTDEHAFINAKYKTELTETITLSTSLAYNYYNYDGTYLYDDGIGGVLTSQDHTPTSWVDGSVDLSYAQNEQLDWLIGIYGMDSIKENLVYVNDGVTMLSVDKPTDNYAVYLQSIYRATEALSFKLIYGEAFRAPNAFELYYNDGGDWQKGNPDLQEERIRNYEVVLEHYFSTKHSLVITGFYYEMTNLIRQIEDPNDGLQVFENLDKAESRGVELSYKLGFESGIDTSLNYTYQYATDKKTGTWLVNSPKQLANAAVTIPFLDKYSTTFALQYVGKKKNPYGELLDDYLLANLSLQADDVVKGLDLSAAVYNLFDSVYSSSGGIEHYQKEIIQDGISGRVKATYKF